MDRIKLDETPITGALRDLQPLALVRVDTKEKERLWDFMVHTWHYLSYESIIGPRIKYLVFQEACSFSAVETKHVLIKIGL